MWRQLIIQTTETAAPELESLLWSSGAHGLEVEDDETRTKPGQPIEHTGMVKITATFDPDPSLEQKFQTQLIDMPHHWRDLAPTDWEDRFKKEWRAFTLGENIWIVPSWESESFTPPKNSLVLHLDPGMAFGTGHHETTALCARAIKRLTSPLPLAGEGRVRVAKLLDVGTGTGILSIIALKLGANEAYGTEIDEESVRAANENAQKNGVSDRFKVFLDTPPNHWGAQFDLVVANILAEPLTQLAPQIVAAMKPGATLILSGLLKEQEASIRKIYESHGLQHLRMEQQGDWVAIELEK